MKSSNTGKETGLSMRHMDGWCSLEPMLKVVTASTWTTWIKRLNMRWTFLVAKIIRRRAKWGNNLGRGCYNGQSTNDNVSLRKICEFFLFGHVNMALTPSPPSCSLLLFLGSFLFVFHNLSSSLHWIYMLVTAKFIVTSDGIYLAYC